jgi:hypothetical protein
LWWTSNWHHDHLAAGASFLTSKPNPATHRAVRDVSRLWAMVAFALVMWRIAIHAMTSKLIDWR